jgi:ferredoxin
MLRFGPSKRLVKFMVSLSWPIMIAAKKWSSLPILRWIINPFFRYPHNEVTSIPINVEVRQPESIPIPRRVVERLVTEVDDIFIIDECICRSLLNCGNYPIDIGCIALGSAIRRMHPSHGKRATREEATAHVRRAAEAGLIANIAHVWIDPVAFGLTPFKQLMFICFCDDCCCLYRTHMKKRGPNLDRAYQKLLGISIEVDAERCNGCGICVDSCFVAAMKLQDGVAIPGESCKGCGRCVELCPQGAATLRLEDEETLYKKLRDRIADVSEITK